MAEDVDSYLFDLTADEIHVWQAWLRLPRERLADLRAYLSPDEIARAERLRFEADRRQFITARGILRELCGNYASMPPEQVQFAADEHGKPCVANLPPGLDLRFNLAHSADVALYAFALGAEVGIDLEAFQPGFGDARIEASLLPPEVIARLLDVFEDDRQQAFLEEWTGREAVAKATGLGMAHFLEGGADPGRMHGWEVVFLPRIDGYVCALARPEGRWRVRCLLWGPNVIS